MPIWFFTTANIYNMPLNYEFKAHAFDIEKFEKILLGLHPQFVGTDHQVDTYFNTAHGRLKLREGNIENALIHYHRINSAGARQSDVTIYPCEAGHSLKQILTNALGVKVVVDKKRKIYYLNNVKFHFDSVEGLGHFVEVEAIDKDGSISIETLKEQCNVYAQLFQLNEQDYIAESYSDMLLVKKSSTI